MGLSGHRSQPTGEADIGTVAVRSAEGVTWERTGLRPSPGQEHAAIESARKRHAHLGRAADISGRHPAKDILQLFRVGLRRKRLLLLPRSRVKVTAFLDPAITVKGPLRPRRQEGDVAE